jgi:D-3-phosphoglycerate dehydrogenase / 2-oxoglutarate reductase
MPPGTLRSPRALLVENIDQGAVELLAKDGWEVEHLNSAIAERDLLALVGDVELLGIRSKTQVTASLLDAAPRLLAVGAFCIGVNQIDLPAATRRGVGVFNAPFSNTRSVVELTLAEIIALTRRLTVKDRLMHEGVWDKSATGSHEVRGRRLGIVGYGNIGSQLSVLAEGLGMSVWYYDTADRLALGNARRCGSLDELLEGVDVVSLHVDGRPANRGFFGEEEFSRMRRGSLFLNLSRGFVVDHRALRVNIEQGRLAGAAVDVFPEEPSGKGEPFASDLRGVDNVILTPHIGGSTEEAQVDIGQFVTHKLLDFVRTGATTLSVNLPDAALAQLSPGHALVHVHHNTPGVLAQINGVLAANDVNIEGQALGTRGEVGYVITEIAGEVTDEMIERLTLLEGTIRVRRL